jgi:hypothetical protein
MAGWRNNLVDELLHRFGPAEVPRQKLVCNHEAWSKPQCFCLCYLLFLMFVIYRLWILVCIIQSLDSAWYWLIGPLHGFLLCIAFGEMPMGSMSIRRELLMIPLWNSIEVRHSFDFRLSKCDFSSTFSFWWQGKQLCWDHCRSRPLYIVYKLWRTDKYCWQRSLTQLFSPLPPSTLGHDFSWYEDQHYGIHISILCLEIKKAHNTKLHHKTNNGANSEKILNWPKCLKWSQYQK